MVFESAHRPSTFDCLIYLHDHFFAVGHCFRSNALASVLPRARYPTKNIAIDCHMANGRERQVSGHQRLAVRRQLAQETDTDTGRLLGVVFEAVEPVGVLESNLKHGVTSERQPIAARPQTDDAMSARMAAGATDKQPR